MQRTPELVEKAIVHAVKAGIGPAEVARQFDVGTTTVQQMVKRNGDLAETTKTVDGSYLVGGFKYVALSALDAIRNNDHNSSQDVKNYALAMAISIDKMGLIQGWPTQVVAHLHEHRHEVGNVASKLSEVARRMQAQPRVTLAQDTGHDDMVTLV